MNYAEEYRKCLRRMIEEIQDEYTLKRIYTIAAMHLEREQKEAQT